MQTGFKKPVVLTGSQLPLAMPRSDARQNLIDAVTCLTAFFTPPHVRLEEVAVCFGGRLMRGNRVQARPHASLACGCQGVPHMLRGLCALVVARRHMRWHAASAKVCAVVTSPVEGRVDCSNTQACNRVIGTH